jgi:endonuclease YncB( thermonuclease family)
MLQKYIFRYGETSLVFIFILISILGLILFKDLYPLWSGILGLNCAIFTYKLTNLQKSLKIISAILAFIIGISAGFIFGNLSGGVNTITKTGIATNSVIFNQSFSASSKTNQAILNNDIVNFDYNIDGETVSKTDVTIPKTKLKSLFDQIGNQKSTKNFKTFRVLNVFSPTLIELDELGYVQLLGVNSPSSNPNTTCLTDLALDTLKNILIGRNVYLEFDDANFIDANGRILSYVYLESDYFINLNLLQDGLVYNLDESWLSHKRQSQFSNIEKEAKLIPSGIWVDNVCSISSKSSSSSRISSSSRTSLAPRSVSSSSKSESLSEQSNNSINQTESKSSNSKSLVSQSIASCSEENLNLCYYIVISNNDDLLCVQKINYNENLYKFKSGPYNTLSECQKNIG